LTAHKPRCTLDHALRVGATRRRPIDRLRWVWKSGVAQRSETSNPLDGSTRYPPLLGGPEDVGPVTSPRAHIPQTRHTACFFQTPERLCNMLGGLTVFRSDPLLTVAGGRTGRAGP
jgi:hypothetical protein